MEIDAILANTKAAKAKSTFLGERTRRWARREGVGEEEYKAL